MNERVRMQYLEAMGIDMFVPRWVLPGASPSRAAPLPATEAPPVVAESHQGQGSGSRTELPPADERRDPLVEPKGVTQAASMVSGLMAQLGAGGTQSAARSPAAPQESGAPPLSVDGSATVDEAAVRFTLNIWPINQHLLVLDSHQPRRGLPTARLLNNILFAKGIEAPQSAPESLIWPVAIGLAGPTGWSAAREMVGEFLGSRLQARPVSYLWLMGEDAFNAVAPRALSYPESLGQAVTLAEFGTLALVLPSLSDMLGQPALKAQTWAAIAPYRVHGA